MSWDPETEREVEEALAVVRRGRSLRISDHHPWKAPPFRPRRPAPALRWLGLRLLAFVAALLAFYVARQSGRLSGWDRLGPTVVALVILFVSFLPGRRLR